MAIDASLLTQEEYYALKKQGTEFLRGMSQQASSAYVAAVAHAKAASRVRGEQGMAEAVQMMAEQGVHAYAYTRRDGTVVRVPADVGIRRAMREQMRQASSRQAMELARDTGHDLVYIDETPACRDSHKPINGKAFSVTGATPGYEVLTPELEALMRDYGCQHRARLYWPGVTETPEPQWRAEGYADEEMRGLQTEQRALENAVRKAKRSSEAVKAALAEAEGRREVEKAAALSRQLTIANAKVRAWQARVAEHVAAHSDVLTRQPWREALYDSARRMETARRRAARPKPANVEIDEMTPCLRRLSDNAIVQTHFVEVTPRPTDYPGWVFNWAGIYTADNVEKVLELRAAGDGRAQGLLAFKDDPANDAVYIADVEAAPHNSGFNNAVSGKEYGGVGAHLFAEAVRLSYELGHGGCVYFDAKTKLIEYYEKELGAKLIGSARMFIDEVAARRLYERYYGDKPR